MTNSSTVSKYLMSGLLAASVFSAIYCKTDAFIDNVFFTKYFHFVFISIALCLVMGFSLWKSDVFVFRLERRDLYVTAFYAYNVANIFVTNSSQYLSNEFFFLTNAVTAYIIGRYIFNDEDNYSISILFTVLLYAGLLEVYYGLVQMATVENLSAMSLTGSFDNPGPYACFVAIIFPIALGTILFSGEKKHLYYLSIVYVVLASIVVVAAQSRSAWVSLCFSCLILVGAKVNFLQKITRKSFLWKLSLCVLSFAIISFVAVAFYQYKVGSSQGRQFIWMRTLEMVSQKPLGGWGFNSYSTVYNNYQAAYFANHPEDSVYSVLADNMGFAYNGFLQMLAELGVVGLLFFLLWIAETIWHLSRPRPPGSHTSVKHTSWIVLSAISAIIITAFFTYSLQTLPIFALLFILSSTVSGGNPAYSVSVRKAYLKIFASLLIILNLLEFKIQIERFTALKQWKIARDSMKADTRAGLQRYHDLYPPLRFYPNFLYNYGAELSISKQYKQSIAVLEEAKSGINNYQLFTYLANSYEGDGNLDSAECNYVHASLLIPHKLYAQYRLVYIYHQQGRYDKALSLASKIIETPAKVNNTQAVMIKDEMRGYVRNYSH